MFNAIIIDDEQFARDALQNYIHDYCMEVEVVASVGSADDALVAIKKYRPQLIFLDVDMPGKNGFDLLTEVPKIDFKIIFITAHSEYAVRAFRYYATDYLLKPVNIRELVEAVEKVKKELTDQFDNQNIEILKKHRKTGKEDFDVLVIRDNKGFKVLETQNIIKCEANGVFTIFHMSGGSQEVTSKNLGFYEETLECPPFIRTQNSFIVNLKHVRSYLSGEQMICLSENQTAPLGNRYKEQFFRYFK